MQFFLFRDRNRLFYIFLHRELVPPCPASPLCTAEMSNDLKKKKETRSPLERTPGMGSDYSSYVYRH